MATGDRQVNIFTNKILAKTALREQLVEYLSNKVDEAIQGIFQNTSGVLDADEIGLNPDGVDNIKLDLTNADKVVVGDGEIIEIPDENDVSKQVQIENSLGVTYYVGVAFASVPYNEVEINPKFGNAEYPSFEDSIGEMDAPDAVVDTPGVKIALQIDSVTEPGTDQSGRLVKVWLTTPVSGVPGTAFYEGVSYYSAGNNYVDIPYTGANGPLGQDTSSDPPSTTAGDYRVFVKGISWKTNDIRTDSTYAFIGTVVGAGAGNPPGATSTVDQVPLFINTLDRAYDGPPLVGGVGRKITLDSGAVELLTTGSVTGDEQNAQLRLYRIGSTEEMQFMLQLEADDSNAVPLAILQPLDNGTELLGAETVDQTGTQTISFTRGGVDLTLADLGVSADHMIVWLDQAGNDSGLYLISSFTANTVDVLDMQTGAAPGAWNTGAGRTARILYPRVIFSNATPAPGANLPLWGGGLFTLRDGKLNRSPVNFVPDNATGKLVQFFDSGRNVVSSFDVAASGPKRPLWVHGQDLGGGDYRVAGHRFNIHSLAAADDYAINVHPLASLSGEPPYYRVIGLHNENGMEVRRFEHWGRWSRPSEFFEDFFYDTQPIGFWGESTTVSSVVNWNSGEDQGGDVMLVGSGGAGALAQIVKNDTLYAVHADDPTVKRTIYLAGRVRLLDSIIEGHTNATAFAALAFVGGTYIGIYYDATGAISDWAFFSEQGGTVLTSTLSGVQPPITTIGGAENGWINFQIKVDPVAVDLQGAFHAEWLSGAAAQGRVTIPWQNPTHTDWHGKAALRARCTTKSVNSHGLQVDYLEVWDEITRTGPKDSSS